MMGRSASLGAAFVVLLAGCGDTGSFFFDTGDTESTGGSDAGRADTNEPATDAGADDTVADDTSTDGADTDAEADAPPTPDTSDDTDDSPDAIIDPDLERVAAVCDRWSALRADLSEGAWSGDVRACDAGDMTDAWRDRVLESINTHRFLADLPPVTRDPGRDAIAQECALMMHANGTLSHNPPASWACYNDTGASGAGSSNIAESPGIAAMDLYMVDFGNESTFGHRRWFLSNSLGPVGIGSTDRFSCHYVLGGSGSHGAEWVAWPPPGPVPFEVMDPILTFSAPSVDEIGWTVQSDSIALGDATVGVSRGGESLEVESWSLAAWYGSQHAIAFRPVGWSSEPGATYDVSVDTGSRTIEYSVRFVTCDE